MIIQARVSLKLKWLKENWVLLVVYNDYFIFLTGFSNGNYLNVFAEIDISS